MKYVNLQEIGEGPQITALFHLVLHSALVDRLKKMPAVNYISLSEVSVNVGDINSTLEAEEENREAQRKILDILSSFAEHLTEEGELVSDIEAVKRRQKRVKVSDLNNL